MRNPLRGLVAAALLTAALGPGPVPPAAARIRTAAGAATAVGADIRDRLAAIPGVTVTEERPVPGYRYFLLTYTQPVDHFNPWLGTFRQRFSVLHRGEDRPTVFHTNGYGLGTKPSRAEPTRLLDGNQVSVEYRYFTPSRPVPTDWTKAGIRQGAADAHAIVTALKRIYRQKWISTGASKGGMSSVYHRRFYPDDVDGTVAYVAPDEVYGRDPDAYTDFFRRVGTPECRAALRTAQRELLVRRGTLEPRYAADNAARGNTFTVIGSADRAFEASVLDVIWGFWQYGTEADCAAVPPASATDDRLYAWLDVHSGITSNSDSSLARYTAYYYQAGTELGSPSFDVSYLKGLLHYDPKKLYSARSYVPRSIPMHFDPWTMRDIDHWVRHFARRIVLVYGENDPWGAERFELGHGSRDSRVYTVAGGNHGSKIAGLKADESAAATAKLLRWAAVPSGPSPAKGHRAPAFGALDAEGLRLERNRR